MKNLMTRSSDDANSWIVLNTSKLRSTTPLIRKFYFLLNLNCILLYLWKTIKKLNIQINMILRRGLFVINIFKRVELSFDLTGSLRKKTHTLLWLGHSMIEGKKSLSPHPPLASDVKRCCVLSLLVLPTFTCVYCTQSCH